MGHMEKYYKGHNVIIDTFSSRTQTGDKWTYEMAIIVPGGAADPAKGFIGPKLYDTEEEAIRQAIEVAVSYIDKGKV